MAVAVGAQAPDPRTIDPDAIPVEQEPQHRLVFSNELVRVFDARLLSGYRSLSHTHLQDTVTVTISPGRGDPQSAAFAGDATFAAGGYSHVVTNSGTSEQRVIEVEILMSGRPAARAVAGESDHVLEIENDRVRIYRVRLDPGDSIPVHTHSAAWLGVTIAGAPGPGTSRWYDAGEPNPLAAGARVLEVVELEPR
jgi:hypothetical protein